MENDRLLKDRVILVTGAGQGIGRAAARTFAAQGATVILLGRSVAKLEQVYDEIIAAGGPMPAIFPMDLEKADDPDFETLAQTIGQQLRRLDGILHCAASFVRPSPLGLQTAAQWRVLFKVNAIAPFAINQACQPLLGAAPDAAVILLGESHGHAPRAYWGGFAVAKAALEAYFLIQAQEWDDLTNLRINLVIPGPIHSPQRTLSHPGEAKDALPTPENLAVDLARLIGPEGRRRHSEIIEWARAVQ